MRIARALPVLLVVIAFALPALAQEDDDSDAQPSCTRSVDSYILDLQGTDYSLQWNAVGCLGTLGDHRAVEPLVQAILHAREVHLPLVEAEALRQLDDPRAEDLLLAALSDTDTRFAAIHALGLIESKRAVEPLMAILSQRDRFDADAAATALAQIKDERAFLPLCAMLSDRNEILRRVAAESLGQFGDPHAVTFLLAALRDSDDGARWNAVNSLAELKSVEAVPLLIAAIRDPAEDVRRAAIDALATIGDKRAVAPLVAELSAGREHRRAARALSNFDAPEATEALDNALRHGQLDIVAAGYKYFLRRGDTDSHKALLRAMVEHGSYEMESALETSGDPELAQAARDWSARQPHVPVAAEP